MVTLPVPWTGMPTHILQILPLSALAPPIGHCILLFHQKSFLSTWILALPLTYHKDFFSLCPIASCPVKGIGGTSIFAVSIGEIQLHIAYGAWIALQDVLFIPAVTVHLISVSAIVWDSKIVSHFDDTSCWLTSKSTGTVIARGTLLPKTHLYSLPLHSPQADHAYSVHHEADLETWHCRLGHANYQCITSMARKGKINGMSPSLATSKVSKCEPCVLGKQTKTIVPKTRGGKGR